MTKEQAIAKAETKWWESATPEEIVSFQLYEKRLCMESFRVFHEAVETILQRPVFTHEFCFPERLQQEFEGKKASPTFEEVTELLPTTKKSYSSIILRITK